MFIQSKCVLYNISTYIRGISLIHIVHKLQNKVARYLDIQKSIAPFVLSCKQLNMLQRKEVPDMVCLWIDHMIWFTGILPIRFCKFIVNTK